MGKLLLTLMFNHFGTVHDANTHSVPVTNYATIKWNKNHNHTTMSALSNDRTTIVVWMNINKEQYKWISNWIMWKKKNEKNRAQPKRISAHLKTHCTTTWHRNGKKLLNHILFKLEFMMFITNDVDPWWMQMRNERAKIVPPHCRSEYQIECSASAVLVDILASWIRRESVRFALNIIDFMFVFITLFSYKNPYFHWLIQWVALYVTIIDPIP